MQLAAMGVEAEVCPLAWIDDCVRNGCFPVHCPAKCDGAEAFCGESAAWEAVVWKRSRHLRVWRKRYLRLVKVCNGWQLTSWKLSTGTCTGTWHFDVSIPYIDVGPGFGFPAALKVEGALLLGANTKDEIAALEALCVILNGALMRCSSASVVSPLYDSDCQRPPTAAHSMKPEAFKASRASTDSVREGGRASPLRPRCEACALQPAGGQLVTSGGDGSIEMLRWLCGSCSSAERAGTASKEAGGADGSKLGRAYRCKPKKEWLALLENGALVPEPSGAGPAAHR